MNTDVKKKAAAEKADGLLKFVNGKLLEIRAELDRLGNEITDEDGGRGAYLAAAETIACAVDCTYDQARYAVGVWKAECGARPPAPDVRV